MRNNFYLIFIVVLLLSCKTNDDSSGPGIMNPDAEKKVLFIGNSHTNFNFGLHTHVNGFANSYSIIADVRMSAPGGFTLEDHVTYQPTLDLISAEDWDYIILQENTFRAANEPGNMLSSVQDLKSILDASAASSTVLLFKTWAYQSDPNMITALNEVYDDARLATGYSIVSIGTIWNDFIASQTINIYDGDGIHPNIQGTYLTAAIFYKKLFQTNTITDSNYNSTLNAMEANTIKSFVSTINL